MDNQLKLIRFINSICRFNIILEAHCLAYAIYQNLTLVTSSDLKRPHVTESVKNWYRGGPHMIAIMFIMGTKYNCNLTSEMDYIWLQWWSKWGPNMNAICITKGTKYDCNLNSDSGHMWLQSSPIWTQDDLNDRKFVFTRFIQKS